FSSRRRHTRFSRDWSSDVCSSDLLRSFMAPTCSTTAALVVGDALAMALMKLRNFQPEDFARFHPGGQLGKRLLLTVRDLMRTGRSEERRVGKECRSGRSRAYENMK